MNDLEKPSTPIQETAEEQDKALEQQDEKNEESIMEDNAALLSDVNTEIENKKKYVDETKSKISDLRKELGLPPSSEVPPSVRNGEESISKLNQDKSVLEGKVKIQEATNEAQNEDTEKFERNFKAGLENISSQSKTMLDALYERQQERLTPLQSSENFQMMASSIRNLKNFEGKIDIDSISETTENINKLSRLFDDIKIKPSGQIKENAQNLEKLAFGAKRLSASCEESKNKFPIEMMDNKMEEKSIELRKSLQRLSEQTQKLWLFAAKLRESTR